MSIAVTKQCNIYKKNNTGKVVGGSIGAAAGATIASNNLGNIRSFCNESTLKISAQIVKDELAIKAGQIANLPQEEISKLKNEVEIEKLLLKGLSFLKKHPIAISAGVGALGLFVVGGMSDGISNVFRRHKADKQASLQK